MTVFEWLQKPLANGQGTVLGRLSYLTFMNHGYMTIQKEKKTALANWEEMVELSFLAGRLEGMIDAGDNKDWPKVRELLDKESKRLAVLQQQHAGGDAFFCTNVPGGGN